MEVNAAVRFLLLHYQFTIDQLAAACQADDIHAPSKSIGIYADAVETGNKIYCLNTHGFTTAAPNGQHSCCTLIAVNNQLCCLAGLDRVRTYTSG